MDNFKQIQEAIINAVNTIVEKKLKNIKRNYYVDGVVKNKNDDYTYNVLIANEIYENIPSQYKLNYEVGDIVQILVKNGDWNKKFISSTSYHKKFLTSTHYNSIDGTGVEYPLICDNGANIWIGAEKRASRHHAGTNGYGGGLYISAGYDYDNKKGKETIYVCVPNDENTNGTNYKVMHNGNLVDYVYPVGSIYMSVNDVSPATFLGGTWVRWGEGRVPVGVNSGNPDDTDFGTVEYKAGARSTTLTVDQIPSHTHGTGGDNYFTTNKTTSSASTARIKVAIDSASQYYAMGMNSEADDYGGLTDINETKNTGATGGGSSHSNLQPYITCFMWKRTA